MPRFTSYHIRRTEIVAAMMQGLRDLTEEFDREIEEVESKDDYLFWLGAKSAIEAVIRTGEPQIDEINLPWRERMRREEARLDRGERT